MAVSSSVSSDGREVTIQVSGRFDFSQHQAFRTVCNSISVAVQKFVVDLGGTDYVDSSALGMLLVLRDKVGEKKENVKIVKAKPEVKKILEIANFDKLFLVA